MREGFDNFFIEERHKHISRLGDRLEQVETDKLGKLQAYNCSALQQQK